MRIRWNRLGWLAAIALVITSCSKEPEKVKLSTGTGEKILLRLRLEKGKSYKVQMTAGQKITQNIQGREQEISQTIGILFKYAVQDVAADGTASIDATYDAVTFKQDGPKGVIEYDSANPPKTPHPMTTGLAALVGQRFSMKMSNMGEVKEVTGVEAMLDKMAAALPAAEGAAKEPMEKVLREQFGPEALKEIMQTAAARYPREAMGVGGTWVQTLKLTKGFPMIADNVCTLTARKDGIATIRITSKVSSDPEAGPLDLGAAKMTCTFSGTQEGTQKVDETTGWLTEMVMRQDFSGEMKIEGAPGKSKPIVVPMSVKGTVRLEAVK